MHLCEFKNKNKNNLYYAFVDVHGLYNNLYTYLQ